MLIQLTGERFLLRVAVFLFALGALLLPACAEAEKKPEGGDLDWADGEEIVEETEEELIDVERTWLDPATGLLWQKDVDSKTIASKYGFSWIDGNGYCQDLDLDGPGWRMPSLDELRTLIRGCPYTELGGGCYSPPQFPVGEQCGSCFTPMIACHWPKELFGPCEVYYWSSTTYRKNEEKAMVVDFYGATISAHIKDWNGMDSPLTRCVRDVF